MTIFYQKKIRTQGYSEYFLMNYKTLGKKGRNQTQNETPNLGT